ncbi:hypothetical protein ACFPMF_01795 [Larkinella bovis]|uniref:SGNH/GDSL hydrolase family protein n=1 Tax=Larkinella bovis TaxID=683041 RepID=A0ABW0I3V2_9BACT
MTQVIKIPYKRGRDGRPVEFSIDVTTIRYKYQGEDNSKWRALGNIQGPNGWLPVLGGVSDGERRLLRVVDWAGGAGVKPPIGVYLSEDGYTTDSAQAVSIRGERGPRPDHQWVGTVLKVQHADGTLDDGVNLKGEKGDTGDKWVNWQGAWQANTPYEAGDGVENEGNSYRRKTDGTDTVFNLADWDLLAQGGTVANGTVTNDKLSGDVAFKNYPWATTANPISSLRNGIPDLKLYGVDPSKLYTISNLRRNSGANWQVTIQEWTGSALGPVVFNWQQTDYTETTDTTTITIYGSGNLRAEVSVKWSAMSSTVNNTGMTYPTSGIHPKTYQADPYSLINKTVLRNFPWVPSATPTAQIRAGIRDISLYGVDVSKMYTLGIVKRNASNVWQLSIYEWTGSALGSLVFNFQQTGYTEPGAGIDTIKITTGGGLVAVIVVDWSQLTGVNSTGIGYNTAGISPLCYQSSVAGLLTAGSVTETSLAPGAASTTKIPDAAVTIPKLESAVVLKNYPWQVAATPSAVLRASILDVKLFNVPSGKLYALSTFRRNVTVSGVPATWQIIIQEWNGSSLGATAFSWSKVNYVPGADIETIAISGSGKLCEITIDWTQVTEGLNISGASFNSAGISPRCSRSAKPVAAAMDVVLPPKLHLINGAQYWFYDDAIVRNSYVFEREPLKIDLSATRISDGTAITPFSYMQGQGVITGGENFNLTVKVQDYSAGGRDPYTAYQKTIQVASKAKPTGATINLLLITDSFFDAQWGDGAMAYLNQFALADGNTINFKGTRTSYGYRGECYAGWSEVTFLTKYIPTANRANVNAAGSDPNLHSPFLFSTDDTPANAVFDFAQYRTSYGIGAVDVVCFHLGVNGGDGTQMNQMIASIKADLPACKILVCMVPPAEKNRAGFDSVNRQGGRLIQNDNYISKFGNREAEGIYLVPVHMSFNREYGYAFANAERMQFNLNSAPARVVQTDHHPNASGMKAEAYAIYNYLMYVVV